MKPLIVPIAIVAGLTIIFVIADRKEFNRHPDVQIVHNESSIANNVPASVSASVPETKSIVIAETPPVEAKKLPEEKTPAEVGSGIETKLETKPLTGTKTIAEKKLQPEAPFVVPVITREEAEKRNAASLEAYEVHMKTQEEANARRREKAALIDGSKEEMGYKRVFNETFKTYSAIAVSQKEETSIEEKGYDLSQFKQRLFPAQMTLDIASLPQNASFEKGAEGFEVDSEVEGLWMNAPRLDSMAKSFLLKLTVTNSSDSKECVLQLGANYSSLAKTGIVFLQKEKLQPGETGTILGVVDVFDSYSYFIPSIMVKGRATIKEFCIYQKKHAEFTVVEGEIVERSVLPEPEKTDYENCRFTARFAGNAIISGQPCNKELSLSIDGFQNKKVLGTGMLQSGSRIRCAIIPFEQVSEELSSIQEADDLSLFTLDSYLVTAISGISSYSSFSDVEPISFKSEALDYKSVFAEGVNERIPDYLSRAQKERIENDLISAAAMLKDYEKNRDDLEKRFQEAWSVEKDRFSDGYNTIGEKIWRNINHSFWSLPKKHTFVPGELNLLPQSKLDALVALKDFLEVNGIQLIVSIIPNWYDISSRIINQDFAEVPDFQTAMYVKQLSEAGIECPYIAGTLIKNYDKFSHAYLYPRDNHPGSTVQYSVSEVMEERLKIFNFPRPLDSNKFSHEQVLTFGGERAYHSWPENCDVDDHKPGDFYTTDLILYDGSPVTHNKTSEILVVGNSSVEFPTRTPDALQAFLAERLCYQVDNLRVNASGPFTTVVQRFFDNPSHYLKGKKVIILQTADFVLVDDMIPWNNIRQMDQHRMLLNGKKLITSFSVDENGKWGNEIKDEEIRKKWELIDEKKEIKCLDDKAFEIAKRKIDGIDLSKPVLCVVQSVRNSHDKAPECIVNDQVQVIPAGYYVTDVSWRNLYYELPQGTDTIRISVHGKKGTIIGFKQVFVYQ